MIPSDGSPRINRARCKACGDVIESTHVHEFVRCSCTALFVDGGPEYLRRGLNGDAGFEELSTGFDAELAAPPTRLPDVALAAAPSLEVERAVARLRLFAKACRFAASNLKDAQSVQEELDDAEFFSALAARLPALEEDAKRMDYLSQPTAECGLLIGVNVPGLIPGASVYFGDHRMPADGDTLRDAIDLAMSWAKADTATSLGEDTING